MSTAPDPAERDKIVEEKLNADLGMDVAFVEQQLRFRLDLARMRRGEEGRLGYLFIDRENHADAVVVFDDPAAARRAADGGHPLIDALVHEDCLDRYTLPTVRIADLAGKEVILP